MSRRALMASSQRLLDRSSSTYWCVGATTDAAPGDLLLVYVKRTGVKQLYEVSSEPSLSANELQCFMRDMLTIRLRHVATFDTPLDAKYLRSSKSLGRSSFVRKNFQFTTSPLASHEYNDVLRELVACNPGIELSEYRLL